MNTRERFLHERQLYTTYAETLQKRFEQGVLAELLPYQQFVVWRHEEIEGQPKKPPYDPNTRRHADVSDPGTWAHWTQALAALQSGYYNGIGFVVSRKDPFCAVDLDKCAHANGRVDRWAQNIVDELATYTEISPSGNGLHLLTKARLPGPGRKAGSVELYDQNHYITLAGRHVPGTPRTIEPSQIETSLLYYRLAPPDHNLKDQSTGGATVWQAREPGTREVEQPADERVIREALAGQKSNFSRYWSGDETLWTGSNPLRKSRSEAEHTLALMLLTCTGDNEEDTKRLYRQSGLYDEQRCRRISGHDPQTGKPLTYLDVTVRNALRYRQALHKRQRLT